MRLNFLKGQSLQTRILGVVLVSMTLVALPWADEPAGTPSIEHQVKIAFLYNFVKFVDWPADVFHDATSPLILGVLGNDGFCREIEQSLQGKIVNGRRLVVRRPRPADSLTGFEVLFISPSQPDFHRVLAGLGSSPVLTVGDAEDFARLGGMINFRVEENKVRFEINPAAATRAGLRISSRLLGVARVIQGGDSPEGRP